MWERWGCCSLHFINPEREHWPDARRVATPANARRHRALTTSPRAPLGLCPSGLGLAFLRSGCSPEELGSEQVRCQRPALPRQLRQGRDGTRDTQKGSTASGRAEVTLFRRSAREHGVPAPAAGFIALPLAPHLGRGHTSVTIPWPGRAAREHAAWLREWLHSSASTRSRWPSGQWSSWPSGQWAWALGRANCLTRVAEIFGGAHPSPRLLACHPPVHSADADVARRLWPVVRNGGAGYTKTASCRRAPAVTASDLPR